jgi:hypothetical protein
MLSSGFVSISPKMSMPVLEDVLKEEIYNFLLSVGWTFYNTVGERTFSFPRP